MYKYIKRFLDVLLSLIFLIILFIPMLIIMLLIIIIDKEKPIFSQIRTGKNGKEFRLYKFRSIGKDKKYTKVGKILRKTSLDELPQMFNILIGNMSFVGPRPWIIDYYEYMNDYQRRRVEVLPGITGLAQVNGRNGISIFDKIEYDIKYIENYSFITDMKIIFKTIYVIIKKENIDLDEKGIKGEIELLKKQK